MATIIQIRNDVEAAWISANPILAQGEIALSTDVGNKCKIGDAVHTWTALPYADWGKINEASFVDEIPGGVTDGVNTSFVLSFTPYGDSLQLRLNGLELAEGALADYTLISNNITMNYAPLATDRLIAHYRK